jgi:hypothetical protein
VRSGRRGRRRGRQSGRERHKKAQDDNKNRDDDVASEPHENPRTTVFRRVGFATSWTQQPASREPAHTIPGVWCFDPDPHLTESSRPPDRRTMAVTMPQRIVGSSCQLHSAAEKRRSIRPVQVLKLIRIVCQPMPTVATRCYSIQSAILHATCLRDCSCWSPVVRNRLRVFVDVEEVAGSIPAAPTSTNGQVRVPIWFGAPSTPPPAGGGRAAEGQHCQWTHPGSDPHAVRPTSQETRCGPSASSGTPPLGRTPMSWSRFWMKHAATRELLSGSGHFSVTWRHTRTS